MFEVPGSDVISVHVTEEVVFGKIPPVYIRGRPVEENSENDFEIRAEAK